MTSTPRASGDDPQKRRPEAAQPKNESVRRSKWSSFMSSELPHDLSMAEYVCVLDEKTQRKATVEELKEDPTEQTELCGDVAAVGSGSVASSNVQRVNIIKSLVLAIDWFTSLV